MICSICDPPNEAQEAFSSIYWTLSCTESILSSIIRFCILLLKCPPNLNGLDGVFHVRCLSQATHTLAHIYLCIDTMWEEGWDFMWSTSAVSQASDGRAELNHIQNLLVTPNSSSLLTYPQTSIWYPVILLSDCHTKCCSATFCTLSIQNIVPVPRTSLASCNFSGTTEIFVSISNGKQEQFCGSTHHSPWPCWNMKALQLWQISVTDHRSLLRMGKKDSTEL